MVITTMAVIPIRPFFLQISRRLDLFMSELQEALMDLLLAIYREPLCHQERLKGPLLEPFQHILRLAAGKALPEIEFLNSRWKTNPEELRKAAVFYIEQACLDGEKDPYRVLGLNPYAEPHNIRLHYHLLMLLFHPDRVEATMSWRDIYATRVNEAYHQLRRPSSRQAYDRELAAKGKQKKKLIPAYSHSHRQKKNNFSLYLVQKFPIGIRYLPQLILWGGIGITVALVADLYLARAKGEIVRAASQPEKRLSFGGLISLQEAVSKQEDPPSQVPMGLALPLPQVPTGLAPPLMKPRIAPKKENYPVIDIHLSLKEEDSLVRPPMPERGASEKHLTSTLPPLMLGRRRYAATAYPTEEIIPASAISNNAAALHPLPSGRGSGRENGKKAAPGRQKSIKASLEMPIFVE
jgi:hypothetical protein